LASSLTSFAVRPCGTGSADDGGLARIVLPSARTSARSGIERQISGSCTSIGTPAPRSRCTMTSAERFTSSGIQRGIVANVSTRPHGRSRLIASRKRRSVSLSGMAEILRLLMARPAMLPLHRARGQPTDQPRG
jgi:hypothetical protein